MRSRQFLPKTFIAEGGRMFATASEFDQKQAPEIVKGINAALGKTGIHVIPVGSGATPTPGKKSGDFDVMADESVVASYFNAADAKQARKALSDYIKSLGYETAQSGVNVHMLLPMKSGNVQVDIMVVPQAEAVSKFHIHRLPEKSKYKGMHKHIVLSKAATLAGYLWSPWQGLYKRDQNGKKGEYVTNDQEQIAKLILGRNATADSLGSAEAILASLPADKKDIIMSQLAIDPNWQV